LVLAISPQIEKHGGPRVRAIRAEFLDAAALCRQLVPEGSVNAFLADHRFELFPDDAHEASRAPAERLGRG
jgi:hypothetical protein